MLPSLIQLSKPFDFRIPWLLFDFSPVKFPGKIDKVWTGGHQCKFWYQSSHLPHFPHLTMLIAASFFTFDVKTLGIFFPILPPSPIYHNTLQGSMATSFPCLQYFSHAQTGACRSPGQARNCSKLQQVCLESVLCFFHARRQKP